MLPHLHLRKPLLVALTALCLTLTAASCSSEGASSTTTSPATTVASTTTGDATDPAAPTPVTERYAVGRRSLTFVDAARGTDGNEAQDIEPEDTRTLPVMVLYPTDASDGGGSTTTPAADADSDADSDAEADAAADAAAGIVDDAPVAEGRFPLVIFSHGITASGPAYTAFLADLAAHGYVVAAPTYPLTSGAGGWQNVTQVANQPDDVRFLIDELLAKSADADDPFADRIAPAKVGVGGHSLGAITSFGLYSSCCRDDRVAAVVALSGMLLPVIPGDWDDPPPIPLLMIHGEQDATLSYDGGSAAIFDQFADVPRALIHYPEGGHVDVVSAPPYTLRTQHAMRAFFDLELRGDDAAWKQTAAEVEADGVGKIEVAGGLEPAG